MRMLQTEVGGGAGYQAAPARISLRRWAAVVALPEAGIATIVVGLLVFFRFGETQIATTGVTYSVFPALVGPLWVLTMWAGGAYDTRFMSTGAEEYRRVVNAAIWLLAVVALTALAFQAGISRSLVAIAMPAMTLGTLLNRAMCRAVLRRRLRGRSTLHRTVIIGAIDDGLALVRHMERTPHVGFSVLGYYEPISAAGPGLREHGEQLILGPEQLVASVQQLDADTIAVTHGAAMGSGQLRRLSWELEGTGIDLLVAPSLTDVAGPRVVVRPVQGLPLLQIEEPQFRGAKRVVKAGIDRVMGCIGIALASPLLLVTAIVIKIFDSGPVFYKQIRVGQHGQQFVIWKFRTMTLDAEHRHQALMVASGHDGVLFKLADDPRVTPIGRFLRRYSIDELPQLLNVITGAMSLVGPRPQRPFEVAQYGADARRRLLVKPGMTGLWQVSGRNTLSWEETIQLDLHYVDNWSVTRDLVILARTAWAVVRGPGAF